MTQTRLTDHDDGRITFSVDGEQVREWSYATHTEQGLKMRMAREFSEGWYQASLRLENVPTNPNRNPKGLRS